MDATRVRFHSVVEWLLAAAFIVGFVAIVSEMQHSARALRAVMPVIAEQTPEMDAPAGIPPGAVSLPMLMLPDGKAIELGDRASAIVALLGPSAQIGAETVQRDGARERITRPYNYAGRAFDVVLESSASAGEPRVTALYLH